MPIDSDVYTGGTGGGSTTSVCSISPSDNIAVLNNYGSRLSDIERFLSRVVAADVYASNLSDLAENLGNVLNGTIMLSSTSNSPYGVGGSIPVPSGYSGTVISGNVITTWNNGVVSFEVVGNPLGGSGTGVTVGVSGGITDYMKLYLTDKNWAAADTTIDWTGILSQVGSSLSWTSGDSDTIHVQEAGVYLVVANLEILLSSSRTEQGMGITISCFDSGGTGLGDFFTGSDMKTVTKTSGAGTKIPFRCTASAVNVFSIGDQIRLASTFFTNDEIQGCKMMVVKLI